METHLSRITEIIEDYNNATIITALLTSTLLRELTSELFFLEKYRAEAHTRHNGIIFNRGNKSVAAATVEANEKEPNLYLIRRVMNAAYKVTDAMRSNISTLNKER